MVKGGSRGAEHRVVRPNHFRPRCAGLRSAERLRLRRGVRKCSRRQSGVVPVMKSSANSKKLTANQWDDLLTILKTRYLKNRYCHPELEWAVVEARLKAKADKGWSLHLMEATGGEPDMIELNEETGECLFFDCSVESPIGRRSLCFDRKGLESRKEHKPADSAMEMAKAMGIELLTEAQYRHLQSFGDFDSKTSSWVQTPADIRKLGGALACDRRYGHVFVYPSGAQSYYAARGFRGCLWV